MKYRYIGKLNLENKLIMANTCISLNLISVPQLNLLKCVGPNLNIEYKSKEEFELDWQPLTVGEENIVERFEKKYKGRLFSPIKAQEILNANDPAVKLVILNGKYYDITGINQDDLLKFINGMNGSGVRSPTKKDKIYRVNNPFMSREGQFEEGKRSLVIGLDIVALQTSSTYKCYLGKNNKTYYQIDCVRGLELAQGYKSTWMNKKGRTVAILPIKDFERIDK